MRVPLWPQVFVIALVGAGIAAAGGIPVRAAQRDRVPPAAAARSAETARTAVVRQAYELGYREGRDRGERDGRDRREFNYERDDWYRSGDRGYQRSYGNRDAYRVEYRRGFSEGYRSGYDRYRVVARNGRFGGRGRGYRDPAAARGFSDGYEKGMKDSRDRDRYDPVRHNAYRKGDAGYKREYGSKDAYQSLYRLGFRDGYEGGYRDGTRR